MPDQSQPAAASDLKGIIRAAEPLAILVAAQAGDGSLSHELAVAFAELNEALGTPFPSPREWMRVRQNGQRDWQSCCLPYSSGSLNSTSSSHEPEKV